MPKKSAPQLVEATGITIEEDDIPTRGTQVGTCGDFICGSIISFFLHLLCGFVTLLFGFYTVKPQEEALILYWGKFVSIKKNSGLYWFDCFGRTIRRISTRTQTIDIKKTTVVDANGNPIIVSGVATFRIVNTVKAAFDVENVGDYMERQAMATLKKICSRWPYESRDGVSLQTEADQVSREMIAALQKKAEICGVKVTSYELADLQYAPEIAQGMLVRQQAQALLDARKVIVDGAVTIVTTAMMKLAETGIILSETAQQRLVSNLLAVICSDARVQPMFSVGHEKGDDEETAEVSKEILKTLQQLNTMMLTARQQ